MSDRTASSSSLRRAEREPFDARLLEILLGPAPALVTILLSALIFLAPLALEGMTPYGALAVEVVAGLTIACWLALRLAAPIAAPLSVAGVVWPALGLVLMGLLQVVPLPLSWGARLSPLRAQVMEHTFPVLPEIARPLYASLSTNPAGTLHALLRILLLLGVFLVARDQLRGRRERRRVIHLLLAAGLIQLVLGVVQTWFHAPWIYFQQAPPSIGAPFFGSFISRDRNAAYFNLLWPLALSLGVEGLLPGKHERRRGQEFDRWSLTRPAGQGLMPWPVYLLIAGLLLAGTLVCRSRTGWALMLLGLGSFPPLFLARAGERRSALVLWVGTVVSGLALLKLFWHPILGLISHWADKSTGLMRPELWRATWKMALEHPVLGVGLGTFAQSFGPYSPSRIYGRFTAAESAYLETLAELGFPGLLLALGAIGMFGWLTVQGKFWSARGGRRAVPGMVIALTILALHAVDDVALRGYGNTITAAVMAGVLLAALGERTSSSFDPAFRYGLPPRKAWLPVLGLPIILALSLSLAVADGEVEAAETARGQGNLDLRASGLELAARVSPLSSGPLLWRGALTLDEAQERLTASTAMESSAAGQALEAIPGLLEESERWLSASVVRSPMSGHGQRLLARLSQLRGTRPEALLQAGDAARVQPTDYRNWLQLGRIQFWDRRRDEGLASMKQALALAPVPAVDAIVLDLYRAAKRDVGLATKYVPENGTWRVAYAFGMVLEADGHYQEAVPWFRRLVKSPPESHAPVAAVGWKAWRGHQDGQLAGEVASYLTRVYPGVPDGFALQAEILAAQGKVDDALRVLEQTAAMYPNVWPARRREAELLIQEHREADAIDLLKRTRALLPQEVEIPLFLSGLLRYPPEAADVLRDAIKLKADLEEPRWRLYLLHKSMDLGLDAGQDLKGCLTLKQAPRCLAADGQMALEQGDLLRAVQQLERSVKEDAGQVGVWVLLGQARLKSGDRAGATAAALEALRREPGNAGALELQRAL